MRNPFSEMAGGDLTEQVEWEEVGGAFSCNERGCYKTANEAKYSESKKLLTWVCPAGHTNRIEDFKL